LSSRPHDVRSRRAAYGRQCHRGTSCQMPRDSVTGFAARVDDAVMQGVTTPAIRRTGAVCRERGVCAGGPAGLHVTLSGRPVTVAEPPGMTIPRLP
jgi:hypothetical protein